MWPLDQHNRPRKLADLVLPYKQFFCVRLYISFYTLPYHWKCKCCRLPSNMIWLALMPSYLSGGLLLPQEAGYITRSAPLHCKHSRMKGTNITTFLFGLYEFLSKQLHIFTQEINIYLHRINLSFKLVYFNYVWIFCDMLKQTIFTKSTEIIHEKEFASFWVTFLACSIYTIQKLHAQIIDMMFTTVGVGSFISFYLFRIKKLSWWILQEVLLVWKCGMYFKIFWF